MKQNRVAQGLSSVFLCALLLSLAAGTDLAAQGVDRVELEKSKSAKILFINYEGPYARIESREDIRGIGLALGRAIKAGARRAGAANRYFAVHPAAVADQERLNADIFGLGVDAGVDHIDNLRLILQGYLEGAYDYSAGDAALLAEFITIYNAVYRGDWDYFTRRYQQAALDELSADKAGLSIRFDEWPGRALIVIPLATATPGTLSAVDTTSITEEKVVDEMRKEGDRGVEQRKEMVDLKEREAAAAEQSADLQREAIAEEEAKLAAEKAKLEADKAQAAADQEKAKQAEAAGEPSSPGEKQAQAEQQRELAQREAEVTEKEAALDAKKEEAAATEAFAEQKAQEAKEDRKDIAADQQDLIAEQEARQTAPEGVLGMRLTGPDAPLGNLVILDAADYAELSASAMNTINGRTVTVLDGAIFAVAGRAQGSGAIRLVRLDPKTLESTRQGEDDITPESLLWLNGKDLYALTLVGGKRHLARFDAELTRKARSSVEAHPYGTPIFSDGLVLTQRADGSALVLNAGDLTERK